MFPTVNQPLAGNVMWLLGLTAALGCGPRAIDAPPPPRSAGQSSMSSADRSWQQLRGAIDAKDWTTAEQLVGPMLIAAGEDPELLAAAARIRFELKDLRTSADLLVQACQLTDFKDLELYHNAFKTLLAGGYLFEAIELNRQLVHARPDQLTALRTLYDVLIDAERHLEVQRVGERLIERRQFDAAMLRGLSAWAARTTESESLRSIVERNPLDPRPLVGVAKHAMDASRLDEAIGTLQTIRQASPDDPVTAAYLAACYELTADWTSLRGLLRDAPPTAWDYHHTLLATAALAERDGEIGVAILAVCEAIVINPMDLNAHRRLLRLAGDRVPEALVQPLRSRTDSLLVWQRASKRFEVDPSDVDSAIQALDAIAALGRLLEAEAWAAVWSIHPAVDDAGQQRLSAARDEIIAQMSKQTPWQAPLNSVAALAAATRGRNPRDWIFNSSPRNERLDDDLAPRQASSLAQNRSEPVPPKLIDEADQWGLDFHGRTAEGLDQPGILLSNSMGCGGGALDYNLDGLPDLILRDAGGQPGQSNSRPGALMSNVGGRLVNVTGPAGAAGSGFGQGVSVGDLNADGFEDIVLLNYDADTLLINNGDGTFSPAPPPTLGTETNWSSSGAIADFNGDGLSDLYIARYCDGLDPTRIHCTVSAADGPRSCSPMRFPAAKDQLFFADPTGRLVDRSDQLSAAPGRGLGVMVLPHRRIDHAESSAAADHPDGHDDHVSAQVVAPQVYVTNDMTGNTLWRPLVSGRWIDAAVPLGLDSDDRGRFQGSMGIAAADADGDQDLDLYITNFVGEINNYYTSQGSDEGTDGSEHSNWSDSSIASGLNAQTLPLVGFGTQWSDFDNNGQPELIVVNGHVDSIPSQDARASYAQPAQRFSRNTDGKWSLMPASTAEIYFGADHVGRSLSIVDLNDDGLNDFCVTHQTEPVALLINRTETTHHWINFELVGVDSNRDATTASVSILNGNRQRSWRLAGDGFLCRNQPRLTFGRGNDDDPVSVEVRWPSGRLQTFEDLAVDRTWLIVEGQRPWRR